MQKLNSISKGVTKLSMNIHDYEQISFRQALKWWNLVRWLSTISFLALGIIQISASGFTFPIPAFVLTLLAITLLNTVYSLWIDHFHYNIIFPIIHNLLDIIIFSMAIFMTGGIKSPFLWGYLIPILTSSITIGRTMGFFASSLSILSLWAISQLSQSPIMINLKANYDVFNYNQFEIKTLLSYACLFFLVYFISSFLANSLREQNSNLKALNEQLIDKTNQILKSQEKILEMERRDTLYQAAMTMQHEINNPLTIVSLNTEMLVKETPYVNPKRIKTINDSIERIKNILNKMRSLQAKSLKKRDALSGLEIFELNENENQIIL
ncbi:hypothetical protein B6D60_01120 [candidate division KSB1 bacterium 4484_87]|nr:MAG: hypothetical protein B6D60_01120 [candidate division KSB1 bacterium 4484_87]